MRREAAVPVLSGSEPLAHNGIESTGVLLPGVFQVATLDHCALTASTGNVISIRRIHSERVEEPA